MRLVDSGRVALAAALLAVAPPLAAGNVISFDLNRASPASHMSAPLSRRLSPLLGKRATFVESIANNITGGGYYIDVTVGTPPQPQRMVLDTGSSDAWVVAVNADLCTSSRLQAYYFDTCSSPYDSSKSTTFAMKDRGGFEITYLDGSTARGDYVTDDFSIGGTTIKSLQIGVASQTVRGTGILGVGYSTHVAADNVYPNIIDQLVSQSLIPVKAYSLWLNDRRAPTGNILFGGIDTSKFIGPLAVMPLVPDVSSREISSFTVVMTNLTLAFSNSTVLDVDVGTSTTRSKNNTRTTIHGSPALLDSGTTLTYLPDKMASKIFSAVGAVTESRETGLTFIACSTLETGPAFTMTFGFGTAAGSSISVPVHEMVLDVLGAELQAILPTIRGIPRDDVCLFGIQSTSEFGSVDSDLVTTNFALLGDTFLRSAYVVYDLAHNQVGLAQANLNATATTVVELSAADTALPALTGVATQVSNPQGTGLGGGSGSGSAAAPRLIAGSGGRELLAVAAVSGLFAVFGGAFFAM